MVSSKPQSENESGGQGMLNPGVEALGGGVLGQAQDLAPMRVTRPARVINRKRRVRMLRTTYA